MTPLLSDARLADQATAGDRRAFAAIFRRHHQGLYRFCLSILGRPEDAQDALQNTMVKALHALPGEQREVKLKPWLYRVAHNESIDLLRRRREGLELEDQRLDGGFDIAETAAMRERLNRLFADLAELPERQRSALVMRELAGLGYKQIGEALETSDAVARQTVYEARIALRELEAGREMDCKLVAKQLSDADGRTARRRAIRAHLRTCPDCRALRESIDSRQRDLAALAPLPATAAASLLHGVAGSGTTAGGLGGGGAGAAGASIGKVAATPVTLKAVATVAVVATVGVTAADHGGLIDTDLPGGNHAAKTHGATQGKQAVPPAVNGGTANHSSTGTSAPAGTPGPRASVSGGHSASGTPSQHPGQGATPAPAATANEGNQAETAAGGESQSKSGQHGQKTGAHQNNGNANPGQARGQAKAKGVDSSPGSQGNSSGKPHGGQAHQVPPGQSHENHEPSNGRAHTSDQAKSNEAAASPSKGSAKSAEPASEEPEGPIKGKGSEPEASS